uniref:cAMP-dependent protein kinase n=1 Tax=Graphocephala atropunctata TaxID=36148 RepID=A0A1B6KPA2_9HEMI
MSNFTRLPEYGPLEIGNLQTFLDESKISVAEMLDSSINNVQNSSLNFGKLTHKKTIGVGSFGVVLLMKDEDEDNYYAVKAVDKKVIVKTNQIAHILNERKILSVTNFPFIVHLVNFFSDNSYLYFVLPFISGGDMFTNLRRVHKFNDGLSRFYASQVVLALEYLHHLDFIYRDLKPENILLDHTGYIKLTDFGFGKILKSRAWTLCGTPEYLAPEVVMNKGYSKGVDWWALGVLIFEMMSGRSPFFARQPIKVYEKILSNKYVFPPNVLPDAKDLIKRLLQPNISLRIGSLKNGVKDIKDHLWFRPIDWMILLNRKMDPPHVPQVSEPGDNFKNYENITLKVSETERFAKEFTNF